MSKGDKLKVVKIVRQQFSSNDNQYCGFSKPVECQLLCFLVRTNRISSRKTVLLLQVKIRLVFT